MNSDNTFRIDRLVDLRRSTGMTAKDFAAHLGIKYSTYYSYETGAREPGHSFLILIANEFGVSTDYLLGLADSPLRKSGGTPTAYNRPDEQDLLKKYHKLDEFGKKTIHILVDRESIRCQMFTKASKKTDNKPALPEDMAYFSRMEHAALKLRSQAEEYKTKEQVDSGRASDLQQMDEMAQRKQKRRKKKEEPPEDE